MLPFFVFFCFYYLEVTKSRNFSEPKIKSYTIARFKRHSNASSWLYMTFGSQQDSYVIYMWTNQPLSRSWIWALPKTIYLADYSFYFSYKNFILQLRVLKVSCELLSRPYIHLRTESHSRGTAIYNS